MPLPDDNDQLNNVAQATGNMFGYLLAVIIIFIIKPLIFIWALNTLFSELNIQYGFFEWLAAAVVIRLLERFIKTSDDN